MAPPLYRGLELGLGYDDNSFYLWTHLPIYSYGPNAGGYTVANPSPCPHQFKTTIYLYRLLPPAVASCVRCR